MNRDWPSETEDDTDAAKIYRNPEVGTVGIRKLSYFYELRTRIVMITKYAVRIGTK